MTVIKKQRACVCLTLVHRGSHVPPCRHWTALPVFLLSFLLFFSALPTHVEPTKTGGVAVFLFLFTALCVLFGQTTGGDIERKGGCISGWSLAIFGICVSVFGRVFFPCETCSSHDGVCEKLNLVYFYVVGFNTISGILNWGVVGPLILYIPWFLLVVLRGVFLHWLVCNSGWGLLDIQVFVLGWPVV